MSVPVCEHIRSSGVRCGSPALRGQTRCYYHVFVRNHLPEHPSSSPIHFFGPMILRFPLLEDAASVQLAYMQVIDALLLCEIDEKRARVLIAAINGAAHNLRRLEANMKLKPVEEIPPGHTAIKMPVEPTPEEQARMNEPTVFSPAAGRMVPRHEYLAQREAAAREPSALDGGPSAPSTTPPSSAAPARKPPARAAGTDNSFAHSKLMKDG